MQVKYYIYGLIYFAYILENLSLFLCLDMSKLFSYLCKRNI